MRLEYLNAKQLGKKLNNLMDSTEKFYWAVAWATDIEFTRSLLKNREKICQLVIGTDFSQTSPHVLRKLQHIKEVHIMPSNSRTTFHPKVYCFVKNEKVYAIVGSSNLTKGGTCRNEEAAIFMEGILDDEPLSEILDSVSTWWSGSNPIENDWLNAYELRWKINQQHKTALEKPIEIYRPRPNAKNPDLLFKTWDDYIFALYDSMNEDEIENRLDTLKYAQNLFKNTSNFNELNELQRKAIAGIIGEKEISTDLEIFGWKAFGSMSGFGGFRNRIGNKDQHLSNALNFISLDGEITQNDYLKFSVEFVLAFENSKRCGGVATASRLLAMKRPDYFVCVNRKNEKRLAADLGFPPSSLNLQNYWELVIEPIIQSNWWNEQQPADEERMIWNTRAAMLDVIYFRWNDD